MSRKANPNKLKYYFEPLPVPENIMTEYTTWNDTCVHVPIPLIAYLTPLMRVFQSPGCLYGTSPEKALFVRIWTDLIGRINVGGDCEENMILRQNPSNLCQLQQSVNGGGSWSLAFDYSLCLHPAAAFTMQLELNNLFNTWDNATNNTEINTFAPVTTFVSSSGDSVDRIAARKQALCYAVELYIHAYVEAIRKINHDISATVNLVNLAYGLATALAFAFAVGTEGAGTPVFMAVGGAAAAAGNAAFTALTDAVLDDTGAISELVCCMYNTLKDLEPTKENFAIAVNGCDSLSTNAELIRVALARDISNTDTLNNQFNAFINLIGDELRPAELGLLPDCPCEFDVSVVLYNDFSRTTIKDTIQASYGVPFTVSVQPDTWGSNEFFAVWNTCLTYHYELISGHMEATSGEAPYGRINCDNSIMQPNGGTDYTPLPNDDSGKGIFINNSEQDLTDYAFQITLTL